MFRNEIRNTRIIVALFLALSIIVLIYNNQSPITQATNTLICSATEMGGECQCAFDARFRGQANFKIINPALTTKDQVVLTFDEFKTAKGNLQVYQADNTLLLESQTTTELPKKVLVAGAELSKMPLVFKAAESDVLNARCAFSYRIVSGLLPDGK